MSGVHLKIQFEPYTLHLWMDAALHLGLQDAGWVVLLAYSKLLSSVARSVRSMSCPTVSPRRSAAMTTLESRISPTKADVGAQGDC